MRGTLTVLPLLVMGSIGACLSPVPAATQAPSPPVLADSARRLDSLAASLDVWNRPTPANRRRAVQLWSEAAALYRRSGDRAREGAALTQAGRGHADRDTAAAYLRVALGIARETGNRAAEGVALLWLGKVDAEADRYEASLVWSRQAVQIARELGAQWREDRAWAFYAAGFAHWQLSRLDSAEAYYREAVEVARASGDRVVEAVAFGDIGNLHAQRGRMDSTLVYYQLALEGVRATGHRAFESSWLSNLGSVNLDLGRLDSALVYFRRALAMARASGNRAIEVSAYGSIGSVLLQLGDADSAEAYFRTGIRLAQGYGQERGWAQVGLGETQLRLGQRDSALVSLREGLAFARESGHKRLEASTLDLIGLVHLEADRADSALAALQDGLLAARAAQSLVYAASALQHLGDLHARAGRPADLAQAVAYYDSAAAARADVAATAGGDQNRVSYAEAGGELIDRWALAWLARADQVGGEASTLAALAVSERGHAQALLELMRRDQARGDAADSAAPTIPAAGADLVAEGRALAATARTMHAPVLTYLVTKDTLLAWLVLPSGEVRLARHPISRDSVTRLVAALRATVDGGHARGGALRAIEDVVEPGAQSGSRRTVPLDDARANAMPLSHAVALLLPPELTQHLPPSGELVIVPHGPLALVPYALLPTDAADSSAVGTRYALRYAPSMATLQAMLSRADAGLSPAAMRRRAVVVGNPVMPEVKSASGRSINLPSLPAAEREGAWVARKFGVDPLIGGAATERTVGDRVAGASVIHLATHGFAFSSDARVLDSFIALAADPAAGVGAGDAQATDGLLRVGEILDAPWRLSAELVVLSACETGLGNLKQAEGTVGLQRAFLAKGARSVLVSLWSVGDDATELLMRRFYTHWLDDPGRPGKAESLRRAQRDVRATAGFEHPRYWAAFQLVGA